LPKFGQEFAFRKEQGRGCPEGLTAGYRPYHGPGGFSGKAPLGPRERVDVSVTHWAGQYVPEPAWPRVCSPVGYSDPPVVDAEGKDRNVFHGDYTDLAVDSLNRVHVVWTGLNRLDQSLQRDPYTGGPHDGYVQDAMCTRR
jgi:hypothetical protein